MQSKETRPMSPTEKTAAQIFPVLHAFGAGGLITKELRTSHDGTSDTGHPQTQGKVT